MREVRAWYAPVWDMTEKTILLVEDSKIQRLASERTLHKAGYKVIYAANGEQALLLAHDQHPDLILLDMLLPGMRGPEVLQKLKQDTSTSQIPVVVLSSLPQANSVKLRGEGAAEYFEKAIMFKDAAGEGLFLGMIERVLSGANEPVKTGMRS
jgi:CheY-like chemotaxis protein